MTRRADKSPALGFPGGPCHVVERIEQEVRSPALRQQLQHQVEDGKSLSNPDASKVYGLETERGPGGMISKVEITAHAQYRMDLRGVTVPEVRLALQTFQKQLNDWKSQGDYNYTLVETAVRRGEPIEYLAPRLNLFIAFTMAGRGLARVVTVYWKGQPDPKVPGFCVVPHSHDHRQARAPVQDWGTQTFTKTPTDSPDNREKQVGLPSPPWSRSKPLGKPSYNGPGPSGEGPGGRTVHKDMVRTPGTPGERSPVPNNPARNAPVRREEVTGEEQDLTLAEMWLAADITAAIYGPPYPGADRQRKQRGRAKVYYKKYYRKRRGKIRTRMKRWYRKFKNKSLYKRDQKRRRDAPHRYERKPGGGSMSNAERSKKYREQQKRHPSDRKATLFTPLTFVWLPTGESAVFLGFDPESAMISFEVEGVRNELPLDAFFGEVLFTSEQDIDEVFKHLDEMYELADEEAPLDSEDGPFEEDTAFDEWLDSGGWTKLAIDFRVKYRPVKRQKRQKGKDKFQAKVRYRKNKARAKLKSRRRYKKLKRLPAFKKQQAVRRKHPERFKRRMAEVLTAPEIAFVIGKSMDLGYVHTVSGMTGLVTFYRYRPGGNSASLESVPVDVFIAGAGFLSEQDEDAAFHLIEAEIGLEAFGPMTEAALRASAALMGIDCDDPEFKEECEKLTGKTEIGGMTPDELLDVDSQLVNDFTYESEFMHDEDGEEDDPADPYMIDPSDDDYIYGVVNLPSDYAHLTSRVAARYSDFLYEKRPPEMNEEDRYDRATPRLLRKDPNLCPADRGEDVAVPDNPGSTRVIPDGKGFVNKQAVRIGDIEASCGPDVHKRSQNLPLRLRRVDMRNALWLFDVKGSADTYRVRVKALRRGNVRDPKKADVLISCSCPFWQWQGPEHWAKSKGYLYGRPRGTASSPDIKDPKGHHGACKHVLAVLRQVSKYTSVPTRQKRAFQYLADTLASSEMRLTDPTILAVATRYLEAQEGS